MFAIECFQLLNNGVSLRSPAAPPTRYYEYNHSTGSVEGAELPKSPPIEMPSRRSSLTLSEEDIRVGDVEGWLIDTPAKAGLGSEGTASPTTGCKLQVEPEPAPISPDVPGKLCSRKSTENLLPPLTDDKKQMIFCKTLLDKTGEVARNLHGEFEKVSGECPAEASKKHPWVSAPGSGLEGDGADVPEPAGAAAAPVPEDTAAEGYVLKHADQVALKDARKSEVRAKKGKGKGGGGKGAGDEAPGASSGRGKGGRGRGGRGRGRGRKGKESSEDQTPPPKEDQPVADESPIEVAQKSKASPPKDADVAVGSKEASVGVESKPQESKAHKKRKALTTGADDEPKGGKSKVSKRNSRDQSVEPKTKPGSSKDGDKPWRGPSLVERAEIRAKSLGWHMLQTV